MSDSYAETALALEDDVSVAAERAERNGMTPAEIVKELRRIAKAIEEEDNAR